MAQLMSVDDMNKIRNSLMGKKIWIITEDLNIISLGVDGSAEVDDIIFCGAYYTSEDDALRVRDTYRLMREKEEPSVHHPNPPKIKFAACGCEAMFMDTD